VFEVFCFEICACLRSAVEGVEMGFFDPVAIKLDPSLKSNLVQSNNRWVFFQT
jgi:hypothetical protein